MLKFYGKTPPEYLHHLRVGGKCPQCGTNSRFTLQSTPNGERVNQDGLKEVVAGYSCDACKPIPVVWQVVDAPNNTVRTHSPKLILLSREDYDFGFVPEEIQKEIAEALDCLSVSAYNGFAALCRRSVQAICENLGTEGSTKVQNQIKEMIQMTGLGTEWGDVATQIMLTGHDGAHPHLPTVNADRAAILLSLLQDLTYQLYTRPGKVIEAAALRRQAIERPQ